MGKKIFIKTGTTVINQEYCKNCGAPIIRKTRVDGFCCVQCAREYSLMHNPIKASKPSFDTNELPYKAYN